MSALLLTITAGILVAGCFARLPPLDFLWLLIPFFLAAAIYRHRLLVLMLAFCLGLTWGVVYGYRVLDNILAEELVGQDLLVRGRIVDIPVADSRRQRFILAVAEMTASAGEKQLANFPARIQISWYDSPQPVLAGEEWQFLVRLKQPRGSVNPGGFDYQAWLLRRDIGAQGYVGNGPANQLQSPPRSYDVNYWRYSLREWLLAKSDSAQRSILVALLIGDRSAVEQNQWQVLLQTGTNHLIAISGLHVGFVALLGLILGKVLGRLICIGMHRFPPMLLPCLCASGSALFYSALAGFSLPTQRALIMVLTVQYAVVMQRSFRPRDTLLLAFALVTLHDPLAAYDPGFWLSFGAVAVLLFAFIGRITPPAIRIPGRNLFYSQWVVFIGLLLPLALLTNTASLLAPIANLVAIPLVTFVVVPVLLLAAAIRDLLPGLTELLLGIGDIGLQALFRWLQILLDLADGCLYPTLAFNPRAIVLAALALLLILLPRALPGRWLGYPMLLIALWIPVKMRAPLQLTVMDVGQGLAVVVQTPNHTLVYDAGPAYGESFDAGSAIVLPYLRRQNVGRVDKLVISHNDSDHAGGMNGLRNGIKVEHIYWGEPVRAGQPPLPQPASNCHIEPPWQWDEVTFRFLAWPQYPQTKSNDFSCVLLIEYAGQAILLPGDSSASVERRLLAGDDLPEAVALLLAGHHGSRTSSSAAFVKHVRPQMVVFSAGYRNQHGHPHPAVAARFQESGSRAFNTAHSGALEFIWEKQKPVQVIEYRQQQQRYWYQ